MYVNIGSNLQIYYCKISCAVANCCYLCIICGYYGNSVSGRYRSLYFLFPLYLHLSVCLIKGSETGVHVYKGKGGSLCWLCLPLEWLGDILFFSLRPSVYPSICLSVCLSGCSITKSCLPYNLIVLPHFN